MSCYVAVKHQDLYRYPAIEYALVELTLECGHVTTQDAPFRVKPLVERRAFRVRALCDKCDPLPRRDPPAGGPSNTALHADGQRYLASMGIHRTGTVHRYRSKRYDSDSVWTVYACGCEFLSASPAIFAPRACVGHRRHILPREH